MSDAVCAQDLMRGFVESRPGLNLKQKLGSAAAALKWTHGRAKAVLYGEARRIEAREMDQLRRASRDIEEAAHEHEDLTDRLDRLEAMLAALVAHQLGEAMDATGPKAGRSRAADRAGNGARLPRR